MLHVIYDSCYKSKSLEFSSEGRFASIFVMLYLYEMIDAHKICGHHFMMYISQIMLCSLNLHSVVCQLHLNKSGKEKIPRQIGRYRDWKKIQTSNHVYKKSCIIRPLISYNLSLLFSFAHSALATLIIFLQLTNAKLIPKSGPSYGLLDSFRSLIQISLPQVPSLNTLK